MTQKHNSDIMNDQSICKSTENLFKYKNISILYNLHFFTNKTVTKFEKNSLFLDLKS